MTGFGAASATWETSPQERVSVSIEIRTVNGRFREIKVRQPYGPATETAIRRRLEGGIGRGRVEVLVQSRPATVDDHGGSGNEASVLGSVGVDPDAVLQVVLGVREAERISSQAGLELAPPNALEIFRFIQTNRAAITSVETTAPPGLAALVDQAMAGVLELREREGAALEQAIRALLGDVRRAREGLQIVVENEPARGRAKVREWLEAHAQSLAPEVDAGRVEQEVAFLLLKGDVSEELARIASHVHQMEQVIAEVAHAGQGKTLDFLAQELFREISTVGSKLASYEGRALVIELKAAVERIREQVQNVE